MLTTENTVLLIVDVQGKLAHWMHNKEILFDYIGKIIRGAQILNIPILLAEQNPDGLGPTISEVSRLLATQEPISKFSFSCWGSDRFVEELEALHPENVLIAGIETHVCVYQTSRDLVKAGYAVEVIADAVSSRTPENKSIGLDKIKSAGAGITSIETALFELLGEAVGDKFKEILAVVK
jgi:nicotinamidase-related amidase